jgi:hypothetical protein
MTSLQIRLAAGTVFFVLLAGAAARTMPRGLAFHIMAKWRSDDQYYYVESTGFPVHPMMIGITAWQQQVPLPQDYTGDNSFRIPKHPVLAEHPISAKKALFNGAIAVAVNGIPIFNPIKNDGRTDTYLAGELDTYGGHCGRADDYHYHVAPLHLVDVVGKANPIAYALDGFAIYGLTEPDGSQLAGLDEFNGHADAAGRYHYHASKTYPYVNGGMRGAVEIADDHITPQPVASPVRPAGRPLAGAKIVAFTWPSPNHYALDYVVRGETRSIRYSINDDNTYTFEFVDGRGNKRVETYTRRGRGDGPRKRP